MRQHTRLVLSTMVACIASAAIAQAQDRRPPTLDDLLNLVQVSGAEISPDGSQVIYTKSELKKWSDNKRVTSIWIANADGSDQRQLLGSDKDRSPSWSPDGRYVAFLSTRDQAENARDAAGAQIWLLRMTGGGEATKLTDLKSAVRSLQWADDSSRIFFNADEAVSDSLKQARKEGDDSIFVDEGSNGQTRASFSNIWVIALADKQARQLTTGDHMVSDFAPSPDGARVVYIARPNNRRNHQNKAEVFIADVATSSSRQLTTNEAPETNLAWTPDGKAVTFTAPHDKTWELAQGNLYIHPVEGGTSTNLSASFPGDIGEYLLDAVGQVDRDERHRQGARWRLRARPLHRPLARARRRRHQPLGVFCLEGSQTCRGHPQHAVITRRGRRRRYGVGAGDEHHRHEPVVQTGGGLADAADDVEEQGRPDDRRIAVAARIVSDR